MKCFTGGNVLVMQLDRHPFGSTKVQQHVAFPDELDLRPWMHPASPDLAEDVSVMYDLASVIVHKGRDYTAGHYVAVCRLGPAEGICPLHANEEFPNLPQALASVACPVCCARICMICGLLFINTVNASCSHLTTILEYTCSFHACRASRYGYCHSLGISFRGLVLLHLGISAQVHMTMRTCL